MSSSNELMVLYMLMNSSLLLLFYISYVKEFTNLNTYMNKFGVSYLQSVDNFDKRVVNVENTIYARIDGLEDEVHRRIDNIV